MTKDDGSLESPGVNRRVFLKGLGVVMACPLWSACEFVEVFDDGAGGEDAFFDLSMEAFSELSEVGGTACIDAGNLDLLLIRKSDDEVLAVERWCPHQQLNMGPCGSNPAPALWDSETEQLTCQWHSSVFDSDGEVVEWPSDGTTPRTLRVYPVEFDPETGEGVVNASGSSAENGET